MIPYILLILLPIPFLWTRLAPYSGPRLSCMGEPKREPSQNLMLPVFFFLLFCLLALRSTSVGRDTFRYWELFEIYGEDSVQTILSEWREPLFKLLNHWLHRSGVGFNFYLFLVALVQVIPLARLYLQNRSHSYMKMIVFVGMSTFVMMFSGIRQSLAISIGALAYDLLQKKKYWQYLLCVMIASLIHTSAITLLLFYPICKIRIRKQFFIPIAGLLAVILAFNRPIFNVVLTIYNMLSPREYEATGDTGAYSMLVLFVLFLAFAYVVTDDEKMDDEAFALRNMLIMAAIVQCFAPLHTAAMRFNYYFIIFVPLALGKCMENLNLRYQQIAKLGEVLICAYFTYDYFDRVVSAYVSGSGMLDMVPYVPFWMS